MTPPHALQGDIFNAYVAYLRRTATDVEKVYQLEKAGGFVGAERARAFQPCGVDHVAQHAGAAPAVRVSPRDSADSCPHESARLLQLVDLLDIRRRTAQVGHVGIEMSPCRAWGGVILASTSRAWILAATNGPSNCQ